MRINLLIKIAYMTLFVRYNKLRKEREQKLGKAYVEVAIPKAAEDVEAPAYEHEECQAPPPQPSNKYHAVRPEAQKQGDRALLESYKDNLDKSNAFNKELAQKVEKLQKELAMARQGHHPVLSHFRVLMLLDTNF